MKLLYQFLVAVLASCCLTQNLFACNNFFLGDLNTSLVGRSFDWPVAGGLWVINPRGLEKVAFSPESGSSPLTWTSRYNSVTYTQLGPEFPYGGMNEKGLTVETLTSPLGVFYPSKDSSPTTNESQWIQFQLDTAATVQEVIENASKVRIAKGLMDQHYFICDPSGACAVVDFEKGKQQIYSGDRLHARISTNDATYEVQDRLYGIKTNDEFNASLKDHERLLAVAAEFPSLEKMKNPVSYAMQVVEQVRVPSTQLQAVYDMRSLKIHFKTPGTEIKTFELEDLNYALKPNYEVLDFGSVKDLAGNLNRYFKPVDEFDFERLRARSAQLPAFYQAIEGLRTFVLREIHSKNLNSQRLSKGTQDSAALDQQTHAFREFLRENKTKQESLELYRACWHGDLNSVIVLAKSLAPYVDFPNQYGLTPIQLAVGQSGPNTLAMVKTLLENGASFLQLTKDGKTLLQLAESQGGRPEVIEFLRGYNSSGPKGFSE